jgi:hypothetical protein
LRAFALCKGLLFFLVDSLLVSPQGRVKGFLEIKIAATHDFDLLSRVVKSTMFDGDVVGRGVGMGWRSRRMAG